METGNNSQRSLIREAIESGKAERFDEIYQAIIDTGALQYTLELAQSQAAEAKKCIAGLSDNPHKQALLFLADYAVERSY